MKTKLKQTVAAIFTATLLTTSPAVFAEGIPTVDLANIKQSVENFMQDAANHAENIEKWALQAQQMIDQIEHLKSQVDNQLKHLEAIKGARGIGKAEAILNTLNNAPDEWADIYKTVQEIDPTATLKNIKIDPDSEIKHAQHLSQQAATNINQLESVMKEFKSIAKAIENKEVKDPKDAADLTNRIALNTAIVTTIAAEYDIMQKQFEQEQRLQEQAQHRYDRCSYSIISGGDGKCK
ncbi:MAG: hypothetical protein IJ150_08355 [Bacteroidales bacterium]|nr:hypothetical protein [Bacteroidales bacterium]